MESQNEEPLHLPSSSDQLLHSLGVEPTGDSCFTQDELDKLVSERFLRVGGRLRDSGLSLSQVHWKRQIYIPSMLPIGPLPQTTSLQFIRAGLSGDIVGSKEVVTHQPASNSSVARKAQLEQQKLAAVQRKGMSFVRGRSGGMMFLPGGLTDEDLQLDPNGGATSGSEPAEDGGGAEIANVEEALKGWGRGLRTVPPGFSRGYKAPEKDTEDEEDGDALSIEGEDAAQGLVPAPQYQPSLAGPSLKISGAPEAPDGQPKSELDQELDELLPVERPHSGPSRPSAAQDMEKREWAHVVDASKRLANFDELVPDMAHKFPFTLDPFQQEAVYHLEQGDSVFVAAHTSAGKTVVAEYAVALAQKHMTRCIYTSPIKALSNQKFRDFKQTFGAENVGILTGDVQINPEAPCLIMTTEILRSMLYRGADIIRDVEFVVFDEVHYVNDSERGVVWEEVIILCPQHISLILLSATVPNTKEFADWVGRTKKKDIYVISTAKRPVPLEHFLYTNRDLHKIVDSTSRFLESGIKEAGDSLKRKQDKEREAAGIAQPVRQGARGGAAGGANSRGGRGAAGGPARGGRGAGPPARGRGGASTAARTVGGDTKNLWVHMTGLLKKKELLPVVVFVFSKKRCEQYASSVPNLDLCSAKEKSEVHVVIERSLTRLKGSDKKLPQIQRMRELLARGIAVHHGGLLPIVKEIVELLFQRGLVKVLFATETFAMGVNMPARSVVFSGIRKHDGHGFRELLAGEYTQMSGRAGRRGLDATGVVIINAGEELPQTTALHKMLLGQPTKLQSQFRLTYNMILNLLRVETLKVEEMIKRSFSENASQRLLPEHQKKVEERRKRLERLPRVQPPEREQNLELYYDAARAATISQHGVMDLALDQQQGSKIFAPGRFVLLRDTHFNNDPAIVVKQVASREFLVLAAVSDERKKGRMDIKEEELAPRCPPTLKVSDPSECVYDLREVPLTSIALVTRHTLKLEQSMIMAHRISAMNRAVDMMKPLITEMAAHAGSLQDFEVDWSKLRRLDFQEAVRGRDHRMEELQKVQVDEGDNFDKEYRLTHVRKTLQLEIARIEASISNQNLELLPDYEQRVEVLRNLRFVDPLTDSVLLKGRVACEINSASDELVLTELVLDNFFSTFSPAECVALLSVFVCQDRSEGASTFAEGQRPPRVQDGEENGEGSNARAAADDDDAELTTVPLHVLGGLETMASTAERVSAVQLAHQLNPDCDWADLTPPPTFGQGQEDEPDTKIKDPDAVLRARFERSARLAPLLETKRGGLVHVCHAWARGVSFERITAGMTEVPEGSIVRVMTRLEQVLLEVRDAARVVGDLGLREKMERGQELIMRDILAAPSLYF